MEGIKGVGAGGGGGGRVGVGEDDMGDGMQCSDHPYRNNPSGICAFCLQEKLGKLVSSSFPLPLRGSSSSSSSPSFRSHIGSSATIAAAGTTETSSLSLAVRPTTRDHQDFHARRTRIPFLLTKKKKKKTSVSSSQSDRDIVFKRSKSTTTPRRNLNFLDSDHVDYFSPRKRTGFWSFLYKSNSAKKTDKIKSFTASATTGGTAVKPRERVLVESSLSKRVDDNHNVVVVEDDEFSPNSQVTASASSFERKVSRSRSVGCGSRSFSGDFFERISTGFGDCTLRRVESQREGKPKVPPQGVMKERVKCGGLFSGFIMTSSSSSSSSSSYWVSSSSAEDMNRKSTTSVTAGPHVNVHGRTKSWGWAFASPMRAFSTTKPSSKDGNKRHSIIIREASSKNTTPDLNAIPSLLTV